MAKLSSSLSFGGFGRCNGKEAAVSNLVVRRSSILALQTTLINHLTLLRQCHAPEFCPIHAERQKFIHDISATPIAHAKTVEVRSLTYMLQILRFPYKGTQVWELYAIRMRSLSLYNGVEVFDFPADAHAQSIFLETYV